MITNEFQKSFALDIEENAHDKYKISLKSH